MARQDDCLIGSRLSLSFKTSPIKCVKKKARGIHVQYQIRTELTTTRQEAMSIPNSFIIVGSGVFGRMMTPRLPCFVCQPRESSLTLE